MEERGGRLHLLLTLSAEREGSPKERKGKCRTNSVYSYTRPNRTEGGKQENE